MFQEYPEVMSDLLENLSAGYEKAQSQLAF